MKTNTFLLTCFTFALCAGLSNNRAAAQVIAKDDAGVYTNWANGDNAGFGFQPWVMYNAGYGNSNGYAGTFLGNGGDPVDSTNGNYWGTYANGAATAATEEFRALSNSLPVNATFGIRWHNTGIGFAANNAAGFNLRNGDDTNLQTSATFLSDGSRFSFYYIGGGSDNYVVYDGNGVNPVPIGFGPGNSEGLTVDVTLLPNNQYNLLIENAAGTAVLWSTNAQPLAGSGTIDSVALYTFDTGGNQNFNDPEIFYLAPQVQNLTPANGAVYAPYDSQLSFAVTSTGSTISSNNIQLILNGVAQTGAAWTVTGSGTSSNQVTLNGPLQANLVYNGTIIATDAAGNSSTTTFSFNTWLNEPYNIYAEAADYNYSGGQWVDNFANPEPNQDYGSFDLLGIQGTDYLVATNIAGQANAYRAGDLPGTEQATDVDHDNFAANGFPAYDLDYNENGNWEDYTRQFSNNVTYAVYARMATFGNGATMEFSRMATPEVSTGSQPDATLGTFVAPDFGGTQNWGFVPLKDFFSNPVLINFGGTNTFRITDIGASGVYNVGYLLFVAVTNNATLRPYISAGFPYPNAAGVNPQNLVSFTIANQQTSVNPASIELFINSNNVTGGLTLSNNAAGTVVSYQATSNLFPAGNNTATVIFSDGAVLQTDTWQFSVETLPTLPVSWAMPLNGNYSRGFSELIAKGDDSAANGDFMPNLARAFAQLAGTLTNSGTGVPYANEALNGGTNIETNTINYALDPNFDGLFSPTNPFPDIVLGETNNVAMAADMYVYLSPGVYNFDVYSDDGFEFTAGATPASTNLVLGIANFGRAATGTEFSFIVQTNGLYPMQLTYFKAQLGGGGVELYSISQTGSQALLNDPNAAGALPVYYLVPPPTLNASRSGNQLVLKWTNPNYALQSASTVTGPYTTIAGSTSPYNFTITGKQEYFRLIKTQ